MSDPRRARGRSLRGCRGSAVVVERVEAHVVAEVDRVAELQVVGVRRLRGRREERVLHRRAAARAVGHVLVERRDVDLLFDDRAGERAGEVGHVVADRVVVTAVERRQLVAAVAEEVVGRADARRELPREGVDVGAGRGEVLPPLGAQADVQRQPVERDLILDEEAEPLREGFLRAGGGLEVAVVAARRRAGWPC